MNIRVPPELSLLPFQKEATQKALKFLQSNTRAVYNACEQGLGKTCQTIAALNTLGAPLPLLIICPAVMRHVWRTELLKWKTFDTNIHLILNSKNLSALDNFTDTDTVIISYDLVRTEKALAKLSSWKWGALILDEAHFIKSRKAKRTKAILEKLWPKAKYRLALSGTPFTQSVGDGYTLFNAILPDVFTNYYLFVEEFAYKQRTPYGDKYYGVKNADALSKFIRQKFFIRYRKEEVLQELPDKQFTEIVLDSSFRVRESEEDKRNAAQYFKRYFAALKNDEPLPRPPKQIGSVRRVQAQKKVAPISEFVVNLLEQEIPVVFFGWHTDFISAIRDVLKDYNPVVITGATGAKERSIAVERFQAGDTNLFIGNMVAAGVGITLTRSSTCVLGEIDYSPAVISQAVDRLHRIGQKDAVQVFYFVVEGSLEETIMRTAVQKAQTFAKVVDGKTK